MKSWIVVGLLIIVGAIPRLWNLNSDLMVHFDQGLHARAIAKMMSGGFALLGHQTDTDGIFHGPIYYWLMVPAYFLGKGDPAFASMFQVSLDLMGVFFLYSLAKDLFDKKTAQIACMLYAVSFGFISYSRWLSNVTPAVPFSIIFAWGLRKNLIVASLFASLVFQMNGALGIFLLPVLGIFLILKKPQISTLFWMAIVGFLPHLPLVLFDVRHNFVISNAVLRFVGSDQSVGNGYLLTLLGNSKILFSQIVSVTGYPSTVLVSTLLTLFFFFGVYKKEKSTIWILVFVLVFMLGVSLFKRGAILFFLWPLLPIILIGISWTIRSMPRIIGSLVLTSLLCLNLYQWSNFWKANFALTPIGTSNMITNQNRKDIIDWIYHEARGQVFSIWIYTIPYYLDDPWLYYFEWYGKQKYGYLPLKTGGFTNNDKENGLFFGIYEKDENRPVRLKEWLKEMDQFGPIRETARFGSAVVEFRGLQ